jgi:hypothetical protein
MPAVLNENEDGAAAADLERQQCWCSCLPFCLWGASGSRGPRKPGGSGANWRRWRRRLKLSWLAWPWSPKSGKGDAGGGDDDSSKEGTKKRRRKGGRRRLKLSWLAWPWSRRSDKGDAGGDGDGSSKEGKERRRKGGRRRLLLLLTTTSLQLKKALAPIVSGDSTLLPAPVKVRPIRSVVERRLIDRVMGAVGSPRLLIAACSMGIVDFVVLINYLLC